jgi:hypothetical protein
VDAVIVLLSPKISLASLFLQTLGAPVVFLLFSSYPACSSEAGKAAEYLSVISHVDESLSWHCS